MVTEAVDPTCVVRVESEKSLILSVSVPSVVRSFARVREKEKEPLALMVPDPVRAPAEKSAVVMPVPERE